jgi:signal transduction histidine kinase
VTPRRRSLRRRAYAVVVAVVVAPVAMIFAARLYDAREDERMAARARRGAEEARELIDRGPEDLRALDAGIEAIARREGVRVRAMDGGARVVVDHDHDPATSLRDRLGDLFFGPEGAPSLRAYEETAPPLAARPEVLRARAEGRDEGCQHVLGGKLLACHAVVTAAGRGGGWVVIAQKSSPRAIRALYDMRYPVLKLTLYVLLAGLALAAWLVRRIVGPIEALRSEVLALAEAPGSRASGARIRAPSEDEIGDLAGAFNALLDAINARSQQNHAFMADLVHEMKSPVAAVRAAAEALGEGGSASPVAERPERPERIERLRTALLSASGKLDALVTSFLELARAEAGLPNEERTTIDAAELVRGLALAMSADERHAGLRFEVEASPAPIKAVAVRLEAAIQNVLDNAASFAGEGGLVRVSARIAEDQCVIEVSDTGPGIPPENLPRVFDRFFTHRSVGQGTGLGLALAKAIVEAHGGTIAAASRASPARGAIFTIRLPLASHAVHIRFDDKSRGA